jgi:hypothetical protein
LRLKGWGSSNSEEGTYTVVLYIYKYFVSSGIAALPKVVFERVHFEAGVKLLGRLRWPILNRVDKLLIIISRTVLAGPKNTRIFITQEQDHQKGCFW